ncbi:MAG: PfkB family carbohydrate kinase [Candidatus Hodarchaeota archaeon]
MTFQNKKLTSIIFAGHLAIDTIIRFKRRNKPSLGGSVSYCSLALSTYSHDVNIRIISNLGKLNFDNSLLNGINHKNIDLKGIKYSEVNNTQFVLDYYNHSRTLTLKSRSPNLDFNDIPVDYLDNPPDVIVLVPLCNEISIDYVSQIVNKFPNIYLGVDLQGFLRKIREDGKVAYIYDDQIISNMDKIINLIGNKLILKGSEEEMKLLAGENEDLHKVMNHFLIYDNNAIFIMTLGEKGSMIIKKGEKILKIPAFRARKVIDETGAGDVYFSIFLYEFIHSDKTWNAIKESAYFASAAASFLIEKKGPSGFKSKEKVLKRIYKRKYII